MQTCTHSTQSPSNLAPFSFFSLSSPLPSSSTHGYSGHNGLPAILKQMQFHDCTALHNDDFKSHARNVLSTLTNWPTSRLNSHIVSSYWWKLISSASVFSTHPIHSSKCCSRPEFPKGNTLGGRATLSGDGQRHYSGMARFPKLCSLKQKSTTKGCMLQLHGSAGDCAVCSWKTLKGERQRATAISSTCWRETNPS